MPMLQAKEDKADKAVSYALKSETHLWCATAMFQINPKKLDEVLMDAENLLFVGLGCFICEQPLSIKLLNRTCPGEPK